MPDASTIARPAQPSSRRRVALGALATALVAGVVVIALTRLETGDPTFRTLTIENGTDALVTVRIATGTDTSSVPVATVEPRSTQTVEQVRDPGRSWVIRFEVAGRQVAVEQLDGRSLARSGWRIEVPAFDRAP